MVTRTERAFSDLTIPPGELLAEELEARGMTQKELADRTGRPEQTISEIINGKKVITHDTALELEKVLGISAEFWVNLESSYQLTRARLRERQNLEREQDRLSLFPVDELCARGYIPKCEQEADTVAELLKFFGVVSFAALRQRQETLLHFRITPKTKVSEGALWAWLRLGELKVAHIETEPYNQRRFMKALKEIRDLTNEPPEVFIPKVTDLCARAGVAFIVVKEFPKTGANGVARWLSADKALIQLSLMRKWADIFWFSFFHEAKHVLDQQKRRLFVNGINNNPEEEAVADRFAKNMLIPPDEWKAFVAAETRSRTDVVNLARRVDIAPGIVVGRLQKERVIPYTKLNDLRRRFIWKEKDTE